MIAMKRIFFSVLLVKTIFANIHEDRILILDFGSQYTQLIARRVREVGVYCEIYPYDIDETMIATFKPNGIILSGGPATVTHHETPRAPNISFTLGCPVLGICYGMQTMAEQLGGTVAHGEKKEFGHVQLTPIGSSSLLMHTPHTVWMSHGDHVEKIPPGFSTIALSNNTKIAAMADTKRNFYGVQFHPEVTHTEHGIDIIKNFVCTICNCKTEWTPLNIIEESIQQIHTQVGNQKVILAVSGGVDSSVVATLLNKAIGDQLHCVFVNNGLLRLNEVQEVIQTFKELNIPLTIIDAQKSFLKKLEGITDPEQKRKIIGHEFITLFEAEAHALSQVNWLAQGTIYPDIIESAQSKSGKAHTIKSHHNVGGLPETMKLKLIEPLKELFKDEVRKIGHVLGLPPHIIYRHPFPGPGLGIRILGEIKQEYLTLLSQADALFIEELRLHNLYDKVNQAFAVFLPIKSVGVKGDARHYEYVIALRAVETIDFMTARWAQLPHDFLAHVANRIINEIPGISRVVYDISSKPPATIEWE